MLRGFFLITLFHLGDFDVSEQIMNDINEMDLDNYDADGDELPASEEAQEQELTPKDDAEVWFLHYVL